MQHYQLKIICIGFLYIPKLIQTRKKTLTLSIRDVHGGAAAATAATCSSLPSRRGEQRLHFWKVFVYFYQKKLIMIEILKSFSSLSARPFYLIK
jgi:hypothetical protein